MRCQLLNNNPVYPYKLTDNFQKILSFRSQPLNFIGLEGNFNLIL